MKKKETQLSTNGTLVLTSALIACVYLFLTIQFETNDDSGMMQYIAGYLSEQPMILPYVGTMPYTFLISRLYMLNSAVPWYMYAFLFLDAVAVLIVCYLFVRKTSETWFNYFAFLTVFFSLYLYCMTNVQFTTVAGFCGMAAVMLACYLLEQEALCGKNIVVLVALCIMLFFAINIRPYGGYIALAVILYTVTANALFLGNKKKHGAVIAALSVVVVVASILANSLYIKNTDWQEFIDHNTERGTWMNYENLPYEGNEQIYESVGWDRATYDLVTKWCFLDDNVNKEAFAHLNQEYRLSASENDTGSIRTMVRALVKSPFVCAVLSVWAVLLALRLLHLLKEERGLQLYRKSIGKFLFAGGYFAGALVAVLVLCYVDRLIVRTANLVLLCTVAPGIYMLLDVSPKIKEKKNVCIFLLCIGLLISVFGVKNVATRKIHSYEQSQRLYEYVLERKDNLYIGDVYMTDPLDPYQVFDEEKPVNYMFWGGWLEDSPLYEAQLAANGLESLNLADMLEEGRYFVGSLKCEPYLMAYYNERYPDVQSYVEHEGDGFTVYYFRRQGEK